MTSEAKAKKKTLQAAYPRQIVPQHSAEERASILLARIRAEQASLDNAKSQK
nr:hypothetical protein [Rhodoferax sp.]